LDVVGLPQPASVNGVAQKPIEGVSMTYTFAEAKAPSTRKTQYFEMFCNSAIYHDGWVACTTPPLPPWSPAGADLDFITGYKGSRQRSNRKGVAAAICDDPRMQRLESAS